MPDDIKVGADAGAAGAVDSAAGAGNNGDTSAAAGTASGAGKTGADGSTPIFQPKTGDLKTPSVLNPDKSGDTGKTGDAPTDWREAAARAVAGEDEKEFAKELGRLQRFASPADIYKSNRELEKKMSGAKPVATPFPEKGTDAEKSQWRIDNGVPETPEKYEIKLPDGMVIGEADKPLVAAFLADAHAQNASPDTVNMALSAYYKIEAKTLSERNGRDRAAQTDAIAELRKEWGPDFDGNINVTKNFMDKLPGDLGENLLNGRLANGKPIFSDPEAVRMFTRIAREDNPAATVVPNAGPGALSSINDEIATIDKQMGDKTSVYWTGPKDARGETAGQVRYRQLVEAQTAMQKKAQAAA